MSAAQTQGENNDWKEAVTINKFDCYWGTLENKPRLYLRSWRRSDWKRTIDGDPVQTHYPTLRLTTEGECKNPTAAFVSVHDRRGPNSRLWDALSALHSWILLAHRPAPQWVEWNHTSVTPSHSPASNQPFIPFPTRPSFSLITLKLRIFLNHNIMQKTTNKKHHYSGK